MATPLGAMHCMVGNLLQPWKTQKILPPGVISRTVTKKWDPGILDPGPFSAQIMKVEARLGKSLYLSFLCVSCM